MDQFDEIKNRQALIAQNITKSFIDNDLEKSETLDIEKAKAVPVGTKNKYGEVKQQDGTWKYERKSAQKPSTSEDKSKEKKAQSEKKTESKEKPILFEVDFYHTKDKGRSHWRFRDENWDDLTLTQVRSRAEKVGKLKELDNFIKETEKDSELDSVGGFFRSPKESEDLFPSEKISLLRKLKYQPSTLSDLKPIVTGSLLREKIDKLPEFDISHQNKNSTLLNLPKGINNQIDLLVLKDGDKKYLVSTQGSSQIKYIGILD